MHEEAEPLYDDETLQLMARAYEAADKEFATADKALQVTMAVEIIRAINEGERDAARLTELALSAVRPEAAPAAGTKPVTRPKWVDLAALLS